MNQIFIQLLFVYLLLTLGCQNDSKRQTTTEKTTKSMNEVLNTKKNILFFGNSLTAGYGLPIEQAFPNIIQHIIDSLQMPYHCQNAGNSGETTAGGLSRIDWIIAQQKPDIFILELGANDGLRGLPVADTKKNLMVIIDKVRMVNADCKILLAGMKVPPSMGKEYAEKFEKIYPEIANEKQVALIPFLLENVAGVIELNQADRIHPTYEGQKIVAKNIWPYLFELINKG
jgi:acyl-CoA thioesterase-1